ncbi:low molecular weight protein-tyrosine-phosphatase [Corynebacterium falsenii]|uniref:low molecular weight protein-tyrosine-phosphatase n=2 Tax=Corynebacterium falsenii TaxID=108486 RepID=UPI001D928D72|nr:low molecular weight protein-tyrosine-phosphatase [Corynebacterium falsenii]MDC7103746.1 low molecular weight phosphotyrosine protein phosphatase [Corynebacterium falsenii]HJF12119.1 low molecular weight phosphotyrosine protein phosphatase [Corynebacterium falsenii]
MTEKTDNATDNNQPTTITVVCTGNICRSPMGEVMLRAALEDAGASNVEVNSCGLGGWHVGDPADERALRQLSHDGYDGFAHRASQFGPEFADSDVFLAMDAGHVRGLRDQGVDPAKIHLFRSFDPDSPDGAEVADPYYGTPEDFARVAEEISAALPGLVKEYGSDH